MKKILLLCIMFIGSFVYSQIPSAQESIRLYDYADVLTSEEEDLISKKLEDYEIKTSIQFSVVIIESMRDYGGRPRGERGSNLRFRSLEKLSLTWANQWGVGDIEKNNGVFYIFSLKDRVHNLRTGPGLNDLMTSSDGDYICKSHVGNYKFKRYFDGMNGIVDDVILKLGSETAVERYEKISLIKAEKKRIAEEKAEQDRLEAIEYEKRKKARAEQWAKTWPKILEWLSYIFLVIISFFGISSYRAIRNKKRYIKNSIELFEKEEYETYQKIQNLSSQGLPKWASEIVRKKKSLLKENFSKYQENFRKLKKETYKNYDLFLENEKTLVALLGEVKDEIRYIEVDIPKKVHFYKENALKNFNEFKILLRQKIDLVRTESRETNISFPAALGKFGEINLLIESVKIDSLNDDSYKEIFDMSEQNTKKVSAVVDEVFSVIKNVSRMRRVLPDLKNNFEKISTHSNSIIEKYIELVSQNKGELIDKLSEMKSIFEIVLDSFNERYNKVSVFLKNASDESLYGLGYGYFESLSNDVDIALSFESSIKSTKVSIEKAKSEIESKIEKAKEKLKKARKKVKKSNSGKKSKRTLELAETQLERMKSEQGMDIIDWILILSIVDSVIDNSDTAYSQANSAINSYNNSYSSRSSSYSSSSGGGFSGGFGGGGFGGGTSSGGGW